MNEIPQPLYARLRDRLRADILQGRMKAHDKLPSENQLVSLHSVSRITVRQALSALAHEGLIERHQGKGAFVTPPRTTQSLERLQGLTEALSSRGQVVHSQRLSMKRLSASAEVARKLHLAIGDPIYRLTTLRYVDREAVSVNTSDFPLSLGERMVRLDLSGRDIIEVLEKDLALQVSQAQLDITAIAMPPQEARWLSVAPGSPALRVHRCLSDPQGTPLQIETAIHRAETFSYQLTLSR
jgi:GntR family transcriptional regulator